MILDAFLAFTNCANGGTAPGDIPTTTGTSTNILDLHIINGGLPVLANNQGARDIGIGDDPALKILCEVTASFAGGTSMQISLQGATDNGSGSPNAFSTFWSSPVYTTAQLVAGARLFDMDMPRPPAAVAIPRFLQLAYTIVGTMSGGGTLKAFIVLDRHDQPYFGTSNSVLSGYPAGITIAN